VTEDSTLRSGTANGPTSATANGATSGTTTSPRSGSIPSVIHEGLPTQLPDIDPEETNDWIDRARSPR